MRIKKSFFLFFFYLISFAQESPIDFDAVDSLYREDQFYFGLTYNKLQKTPSGLTQNKFSTGMSIGFLRDMPINKSRTWAIALGLGYTWNNYNDNLFIEKSGSDFFYFTDLNVFYDKNKMSMHYVDVPFEIRWRNSTPQSHKFWRIYSGLKLSYLFYDRYKFLSPDTKTIITNNTDLNKFQLGTYLTFGYNSLNFYAYYSLNPMFKSAAIDGKSIDMNTLNLGLMFYIL